MSGSSDIEMKPPSPGRAVNVEEAEREYLGEPGTDAPPKPNELAVTEVNFELDRNRSLHHTSKYELTNLFVRRGQDFDVDVTFNRAPKTETFSLELTVRGAKVSSINRGTIIRLPFSRSAESAGEWGIRIGSADGAKYALVVSSPADAIVGRYDVAVIINDTAEATPRFFRQPDPIYVLFNAWCSKDNVYMPGDVEKDEYVLNDTGYVFTGTARRNQQHARPWVFGQFEDTVTNVVFDAFEKYVRDNGRRDPVGVARKMTCLVNYMPEWGRPDTEFGILVGNWSGKYDDGTSPSKWTGSTKIYEEYAAKGEPVKYGQCWVFSGVLNTALRCLGIPARSVTNFASAHDTDVSMTIDKVYDSETLDEIEYLSGDSVWNFHVWNEAWMSRPDLIPGMGGWQIVDATPQETSEGVYQTGPAPQIAIKQGLTYLSYDTKFCFAEVNADRISWTATKKGTGKPEMKVVQVEKNSVGKYISTKKLPVNGIEPSRWFARQDVTLEYKYPEDSEEERLAVERAVSYGTRPNTYRKDKSGDDVEMAIILADKIPIGDNFDIKIAVNNGSSVERTMDLVVNAHVCFYTGVLAKKLQGEKTTLKVPAGKSEHLLGTIHAETYAASLVDQSSIKIYVFGKVQETFQQVVSQDFVQLTPPEMTSEAKVVGHEVEVNVEFVNPLTIPLTKCSIGFEGARFVRNLTLFPNDVPAKGTFKQRVKFTPRDKGKKTLVIDFDSKQIANITDVIDIEIK